MQTPHLSELTKILKASRVETLRQLARRLEADEHGLWQLALEEAKDMLYRWAWEWNADASGVRAKVFIHVCEPNEKADALKKWDFLEIFLRAWELYEAQVHGASRHALAKQHRKAAFRPLPNELLKDLKATIAKRPEFKRGGARVIAEYEEAKRKGAKRDEERKLRTSGYDSEAKDDLGPDSDGLTSGERRYLWESYSEKHELERKFQQSPLPPEWFGDWASCDKAMREIRDGYTQAFDLPESPAPVPEAGEVTVARMAEYLTSCKDQLTADNPDVSLIAYNSGIFRETALDQDLRNAISRREAPWIERVVRIPSFIYAKAEVFRKKINYDFVISAGSSVFCYVRAVPNAENQLELVCEDWQDSSKEPQVLFRGEPKSYPRVECLSYDGKKVLARLPNLINILEERTGRLVLIETEEPFHVREVPIGNNLTFNKLRFHDATPDLSLLVLDLDGRAVLVNSQSGEVTDIHHGNIEWHDTAQISRDGRVVIFRSKYGCYTIRDTLKGTLGGGGQGKDDKEERNFAIDAAGGLFVEHNRVYSVSESVSGLVCVRVLHESTKQDCAAFSLDSRILAIASDSVLRVYDVRAGRQIGEIPLRERCEKVILSSDGSLATLKTKDLNLLVIDLTKSAPGTSSNLIHSGILNDDFSLIDSDAPNGEVYFWYEPRNILVSCRVTPNGIKRDETYFSDLEEWVSGKFTEIFPKFKISEEVWFQIGSNPLEFVISKPDECKAIARVDLLGESAPPEMLRTLQANLAAVNEDRETWGGDPLEINMDRICLPIDVNHVALGIFPNVLAILDVSRRSISRWTPWPTGSFADTRLEGGCVRNGTIYAMAHGGNLLIWNWRDDQPLEVIKASDSMYDFHAVQICREYLVFQSLFENDIFSIRSFDLERKQFTENPVNLSGFRWHDNQFVGVENQPFLLVGLYPYESQTCPCNRVALIDLRDGRLVSYMDFESPIKQLFRLSRQTFGVALADGNIEAIRIGEKS